MSRDKFPGWSLVEDGYLDEPDPLPEPPRRFGCLSFAVLLLVLVAGVPAPQGAPHGYVKGVVGATPAPRAALPGASVRATSRSVVADAPPSGAIGTALVGGWATYYDDGPGLYAAVPWWTWGETPYAVEVCNQSGDCVLPIVRDFCACGDRHGIPTVIDLSPAAFAALAPLSKGVIRVTVEWPADLPPHPDDERMRLEVRDLPATDTR